MSLIKNKELSFSGPIAPPYVRKRKCSKIKLSKQLTFLDPPFPKSAYVIYKCYLVKIANDSIINFEQLIESPLRQRPRPRTTISYWTM